ncbi:MAG: S41 family peptidase [Pirellulales bacterium]|nr:S41 family peptidase [Pirellulales bacterium]
MQRRIFLTILFAFLLVVAGPWSTVPASAQSAPAILPPAPARSIGSTGTDDVSELVRQGRQMELENRWGEALAHYEEALREFPDNLSLQRRFEFSRMHHDVRRRYSDASFSDTINQLSYDKALEVYGEVLTKIQSHYVEAPHWKEMVERGVNNLEVALTETPFRQRHLSAEHEGDIQAFRVLLRRDLGGRVIQNVEDAKSAVVRAAELAQQKLGLPPVAVILEFTCGAANSLDTYSAYLTPDQLNEIYSQIEGNFVGLGIELRMEQGQLAIVRVIPNSPAERAGIREHDRILAVNGKPIGNVSTDEAANSLQGKSGTVVELTLLSPGQRARTIRARRERVDVPSVDSVRILDAEDGIGYLRLSCFQKTTCRDLDTALWQLHRAGMRKGLVMDLRGNPGGLLVSAVEVADRFVQEGIIVSTRGRDIQEAFTYSAHPAGTWRVPLVVLIDKDSASAAEIFAGAIRDHRRGTIVGQRSYGKGSVQGIFPLQCCSAGMRLTTAKFYSPKGLGYSQVGVKPDVQVHQTARPIDGSVPPAGTDDNALDAALQVARQTARGLANAQR